MNETLPLQIPCTLSNFKSMMNSVRLQFDSQEEIPAELLINILKLHNQFGWLFFGVQQIKPQQIAALPEIEVEEDQKTPSKRLRDRMFVYYKARNNKADGFDSWYAGEMDKIGNRYLEAIE